MRRLACLLMTLACSAPAGSTTDAGAPPDVLVGDAPATMIDAAVDAGPSLCLGRTPLAYTAPTDRQVRMPPSPPTLGPAGSVVKDPTFGTSVLRVTDDPKLSFNVANEFWGNDWSLDSRYFYFQDSSSGLEFRAFDPKTVTATPVIPTAVLFNGGFSRTRPDVYLGTSGFKIIAYDFASSSVSTIVDLATVIPSLQGYSLGVQEASSGLLASTVGGWEQDKMPYIVTFDPVTKASHVLDVITSTLDGKPLPVTIGAGVHLFQLELSGTWITFMAATSPQNTAWMWNVAAGTVAEIPAPPGSVNYGTVGWGAWMTSAGGSDSFQYLRFSFTSPAGPGTDMISPGRTPAQTGVATRISWSNAAAGAYVPFIVASMRTPTDTHPWGTWDDELLAVDSNGAGGNVWRFLHMFNTYSGTTYSDAFYYLYIPRVSQDGQFVLFDSNWNASLGTNTKTSLPRTDMFVAALPNPCGGQ